MEVINAEHGPKASSLFIYLIRFFITYSFYVDFVLQKVVLFHFFFYSFYYSKIAAFT